MGCEPVVSRAARGMTWRCRRTLRAQAACFLAHLIERLHSLISLLNPETVPLDGLGVTRPPADELSELRVGRHAKDL